jgi:DnaK suppressor protein
MATSKTKILKPKELEQLKEMLLQRREELVGSFRDFTASAPDTALGGATGDVADHASSDYESELFGALLEKQAGSLEDVERALTKIDRGDYGVCECCQEAIAMKRLKAVPWARHCLECQQKDDRIRAWKNQNRNDYEEETDK